jgi:hypothetical protein
MAVYRDGVLVASAAAPASWFRQEFGQPPCPPVRFTVSIPKSSAPRVDLSRTSLVDQGTPWDLPIFEAYLAYLFDSHLKGLLALEPGERLYALGRIVAFHRVPPTALWEVFPHGKWPVPFVDRGGSLRVREWGDIQEDIIYLAPGVLIRELGRLANTELLWRRQYTGPLVHWQGEKFQASGGMYTADSAALQECERMFWIAAQDAFIVDECRFVSAPWGGNPPLLQFVCRRGQVHEEPTQEEVLEKASADPAALTPVERTVLLWELSEAGSFLARQCMYFTPPFAECFAYGTNVLNLSHPATIQLLRVGAALLLSERCRSLPPGRLGALQDTLDVVWRSLGRAVTSPNEWSQAMRALWVAAREERLLAREDVKDLVPRPEEFVPGTERLAVLEREFENMDNIPDFGLPLS